MLNGSEIKYDGILKADDSFIYIDKITINSLGLSTTLTKNPIFIQAQSCQIALHNISLQNIKYDGTLPFLRAINTVVNISHMLFKQ